MSTRSRRVLLAGALVLGVSVLPLVSASAQQLPPSSHWTEPTTNDTTTTDGVFAGTFENGTIDRVQLTLTNANAAPGCAGSANASVDYQRPPPPEFPPPRDFSFAEGDAICNGVYSATAQSEFLPNPTAPPQTIETLTLSDITVAVPAPAPAGVTATPQGGGSVALAWTSGYGDRPAPPDFSGYQIYRVDSSHKRQQVLPTPTMATSYSDVDVPATGTYTYEVDAVRAGAATTASTSQPVKVFLPSSASGSSSGAAGGLAGTSSTSSTTGATGAPGLSGPQSATTPATAVFNGSGTLADDAEPGGQQAAAANLPGDGSVRIGRGSSSGAGLLKPFAAALVAAVWAGLFFFLSRRAAKANRALLPVHVEHVV
ncbi:MAG TPA: fibronectin type III domain-containing protein [Acidimicrobiales bacterium]|jgi:hypothetical protein